MAPKRPILVYYTHRERGEANYRRHCGKSRMFWKKRNQFDWQEQRRRMIEAQIRARGVCDQAVLAAMMDVPREIFIPESLHGDAYADRALPIGLGQTISQPYIVAFMTESLDVAATNKVLEVGTGTGYQTAILARLSESIWTVERIEALHRQAVEKFNRLGLTNIHAIVGDGSTGWPEQAPFDRIVVTAAAPSVPQALLDQLVDGGILVAPIGGEKQQTLVRVVRRGAKVDETPLLACRFVKLLGTGGWAIEQA